MLVQVHLLPVLQGLKAMGQDVTGEFALVRKGRTTIHAREQPWGVTLWRLIHPQ